MTQVFSPGLYTGMVSHTRWAPKKHAFRYPLFYLLLNLDELGHQSLPWCLSFNRANLLSFYEKDYGTGEGTNLRDDVRIRFLEAGIDPEGLEILVLTMPRILGYQFNPLTVFYGMKQNGEVAAILYEVHNTFGERHSYLFEAPDLGKNSVHRAQKRFHVSPFFDREGAYEFRQHIVAKELLLAIEYRDDQGQPAMSAAMKLKRRDLNGKQLLAAFFRIPLVTLKVSAAIHFEALRLWIKGLPVFPKPLPITPEFTTAKSRENE